MNEKTKTTKRYRVRRGLFGRCVLQQLLDTPSFVAGQVDASIRDIHWADVNYRHAPTELRNAETN